jgi:NADH-ubiquinone oxidoreductase chain 6
MNLFNLSIEILTILSVFAALAVITSTNPVIAIIFLITLFLLVSIYLVLMGLTFIGLSYLLIYIGAITVLFLFIIMMISIEVLQTVEVGTNYSKLLPLAYLVSVLFLILFVILIPSFTMELNYLELINFINSTIFSLYTKVLSIFNYNNENLELFNLYNYSNNVTFNYNNVVDSQIITQTNPSSIFNGSLQIRNIGEYIYGPGAILLFLSSVLLLLAMVAPIILTKQSK